LLNKTIEYQGHLKVNVLNFGLFKDKGSIYLVIEHGRDIMPFSIVPKFKEDPIKKLFDFESGDI